MKLNNEVGCFAAPKPPQSSPPPTLSPPPTVLPTTVSEVNAQETARKQRIQQLRYGFASTLKNSGGARGLVEAPATGNVTLG